MLRVHEFIWSFECTFFLVFAKDKFFVWKDAEYKTKNWLKTWNKLQCKLSLNVLSHIRDDQLLNGSYKEWKSTVGLTLPWDAIVTFFSRGNMNIWTQHYNLCIVFHSGSFYVAKLPLEDFFVVWFWYKESSILDWFSDIALFKSKYQFGKVEFFF